LNWNENQLNLKGSKVAYEEVEETKVHFRQTLYEAMREVENGLSANERYAQESKVLKLSWQNAQEQERLYRVRYEAGATSLKDLLDAQEVSRQAELLYLESRYRWYINRVKLSLALGG
jgi:outer membrane protein TolC